MVLLKPFVKITYTSDPCSGITVFQTGLAEIPAPVGGSGIDITNEGLKPQTIGGGNVALF